MGARKSRSISRSRKEAMGESMIPEVRIYTDLLEASKALADDLINMAPHRVYE